MVLMQHSHSFATRMQEHRCVPADDVALDGIIMWHCLASGLAHSVSSLQRLMHLAAAGLGL
jgi:hypothetical protein